MTPTVEQDWGILWWAEGFGLRGDPRVLKTAARCSLRPLTRTVVAITIALASVGGCGRTSTEEDIADLGVSRTAQKGPVTVTLRAGPGTLPLDQHAHVELDITAEKGVTILDNEYAQALSEGDRRFEYRVVRSDRRLALPTEDGRLRWTYRFDLEFFLPGEHELPRAQVSFVEVQATDGDRSKESEVEASSEVQTVETESLTLVVHAPQGSTMSPEQLRTITRLDPIDLPRRWHFSWALVILFGIVAIVAGAWLLRRSRRRRAEMVVRIPAHEWAQQQIAALIAEDLIAKGFVQEFHYRISGIARGYIERRFGVSAPEMTTEEFLTAAADDGRFGRTITDELNRFLTACDLVKYARHEPGPGESEAVLKAAGDFVERTRERMSPAGTSGATASPIEERAA